MSDPGEGATRHAPAGVTRREIGWRAAEVLVSRRTRPLPRWADAALLLLLAGFLLAGLSAAPFAVAEPARLQLVQDADALLTSPADLLPGASESAAGAAREELRLAHGAFARYAAGAGWYLAGGRAADLPPLPAAGRPPPPPEEGLLTAARTGPAMLALIVAPAMFVLGRRIAGRRVALVALTVLLLHPVLLLAARQGADGPIALALGLCALATAARTSGRLGDGVASPASRWLVLGTLTGLTLAAAPGAAPLAGGVAAWLLAGAAQAVVRHRRAVAGGTLPPDPRLPATPGAPGAMLVTALGAVAVWVAVSPALWGWLPERIASRAQVRASLGERGVLPDPGSPSTLEALRDVATGPFLDAGGRPDGWWSGLPLGAGGFGVALGLLLTAAAVAGLAVVLRVAVPGRPVPATGGWRRLGRRDAVALLGWTVVTAGWFLGRPSDLAEYRLAALPVAVLLASIGTVVAARWAVTLWRAAGARALDRARSGPADEFGHDRGGEADQRQPAARVRRAAHEEQPGHG